MNFNSFFSNDEIEDIFKAWLEAYPQLITLTTIGNSHENRPIWQLTITNRETGIDIDKPALWIDANLHATELTGSTSALYIASHLLEGYGIDKRIPACLTNVLSTLYLVLIQMALRWLWLQAHVLYVLVSTDTPGTKKLMVYTSMT